MGRLERSCESQVSLSGVCTTLRLLFAFEEVNERYRDVINNNAFHFAGG
jgi:hypothetical protein